MGLLLLFFDLELEPPFRLEPLLFADAARFDIRAAIARGVLRVVLRDSAARFFERFAAPRFALDSGRLVVALARFDVVDRFAGDRLAALPRFAAERFAVPRLAAVRFAAVPRRPVAAPPRATSFEKRLGEPPRAPSW